MNKEEQHKALLAAWVHQRPDYKENGSFTCDGPSNWPIFTNTFPRIVFLSKEAYGDYLPARVNILEGLRGFNIARQAYIVEYVLKNKQALDFVPANEDLFQHFGGNFSKLAEVEVKKKDEGNMVSDTAEIEDYAERDKAFLQKQLEIIDPHVIICGKTFSSYMITYPEVEFAHLKLSFTEPQPGLRPFNTFKHGNRLIIDYNHSSWVVENETELAIFNELLLKANIPDNFDWKKIE